MKSDIGKIANSNISATFLSNIKNTIASFGSKVVSYLPSFEWKSSS